MPLGILYPKHSNFWGAETGWQESGTLRGVAELDGQQHRSAFFLDHDPMAQPSATANGQPAADTPSTSTPAAPAKRYLQLRKFPLYLCLCSSSDVLDTENICIMSAQHTVLHTYVRSLPEVSIG